MRTAHACILACLLAIGVPVTASLVEDTTGDAISYQDDADSNQDAPDTCLEAIDDVALPHNATVHGWLVPPDDESDHFVFAVNTSLVGTRIAVTLQPPGNAEDIEAELAHDVRVPGCSASVLDEEAQPEQDTTPEPDAGEQQVSADLDAGWDCSASRWFFVMNQIQGLTPPATVHVTWTDGDQEDVPILRTTPATVAHYETTRNLDVSIRSVSANIDQNWTGRLNIGEGPCDTQNGTAVFGPANERTGQDGNTILFTPTQTGRYVVAVNATIEADTSWISEMFQPQPANCHQCADEGDSPLNTLFFGLGAGESDDE